MLSKGIFWGEWARSLVGTQTPCAANAGTVPFIAACFGCSDNETLWVGSRDFLQPIPTQVAPRVERHVPRWVVHL